MKKHNNKGIAIFITLMLLLLLSLAVAAVLLVTYNYNNICEGQIKRLKAMASAEAGINYAYYQIREDAITNFTVDHKGIGNEATVVPGNNGITVKVWVEDFSPPVAGKYIIKSKAEYSKSTTY